MAVTVALGAHPRAVVAAPARAGDGNTSNKGVSGTRTTSKPASSGSSGGTSTGFTTRTTSSGRSSGGGSLIGGLVCVLLVIVVVVVLVVVKGKKGGGSAVDPGAPVDDGDGPPPPPPPLPRRPEVDAALAAIRLRDTAFDEQGFLTSAATAFTLVQQAWCERQPAQSRKVMADGIWVRHKQQIDDMAQQGRRNVLENLHIGRSEVVDASTDADSDSITVRIHAYSRDYDVDDTTGQVVRGDRALRLWTEDWTFTRSSTAVTKVGSGTRQQCPSCGAPLDLDDTGTCAYCRTMVMAGGHDWVLSRIDQVYAQA